MAQMNQPESVPSPESPTASPGELALLALGLCFPAFMTYGFFVAAADTETGVQQLVMAVGKGIQFALPLLWWRWHRRQVGALPRFGWEGVGWGTLFGIAVVATMWIAYFGWLAPAQTLADLPGEVQRKVTGLGCDTPLKFAALGCFYTIIHSLLEECYWRWFMFGGLRRYCRLPTAIVISSLGFMAHHVVVLAKFLGWFSPATWLFSCGVAVGGAFWAWLYERSGKLYAPWISHMIVDAGIFLLGYQLVFGG